MKSNLKKQQGFIAVGVGLAIAALTGMLGATAFVATDRSEEQVAMERSVELADNTPVYIADEN